jgi:hypothetical protein
MKCTRRVVDRNGDVIEPKASSATDAVVFDRCLCATSYPCCRRHFQNLGLYAAKNGLPC